jgi:hypothetical protein
MASSQHPSVTVQIFEQFHMRRVFKGGFAYSIISWVALIEKALHLLIHKPSKQEELNSWVVFINRIYTQKTSKKEICGNNFHSLQRC